MRKLCSASAPTRRRHVSRALRAACAATLSAEEASPAEPFAPLSRGARAAPQLGGVGDVVQHAEADHGRAGRLARLHALRGRAAHRRAADRVRAATTTTPSPARARRRREGPGGNQPRRARRRRPRRPRCRNAARNAIQAKRARRRSGVRGVRARVLGVGQVPLADAPRRFEAAPRAGGRRLLGGQRVDVDVQHVQTPHLPAGRPSTSSASPRVPSRRAPPARRRAPMSNPANAWPHAPSCSYSRSCTGNALDRSRP